MRLDTRRAWTGLHPWPRLYDFITGHDAVGAVLWRVGMGSDLSLMHRTAAAELSALPPGATVLDVPCGGGVVLRDVPVGADLDYLAADISTVMLRRTQVEADRLGVTISTTQQDVGALTLPDDSVDLVLAFTSLHCFPDPRAAIRELARVLAPGGRLVGSTMLREDPWSRLGWVGGTAMGVLGPGCTAGQLRHWCVEAGLDDVVLTPSGGITYFAAA